VGRSWQRTRSSALVLGVGRDAAYVNDHIAAYIGSLGMATSWTIQTPDGAFSTNATGRCA
jgi:isocitrate dehydrogenase